MNHLIITLLNRDHAFLQMFDKALSNYLWRSVIHKINKITIIQDYIQEELNMIYYKKITLALKDLGSCDQKVKFFFF